MLTQAVDELRENMQLCPQKRALTSTGIAATDRANIMSLPNP